MKHSILKLMVIVAVLALLSACRGEEQPATPPATEPERPQNEQTVEQVIEEAQETASETAAVVAEKAEETYERAKEVTAETYEKAKEETAKAVEVTKEKAEELKEKAEEAIAEKTAEAAGPQVVIYEARNGNVTFDHVAHAQWVDCSKCHVDMPPQQIVLDQASAHDLCIGCHREMEAGPTACAACHIR